MLVCLPGGDISNGIMLFIALKTLLAYNYKNPPYQEVFINFKVLLLALVILFKSISIEKVFIEED